MKSWLRQHKFAIGAALGHLFKSPGSFLFNVIVVAIALTLPFAGLTLLENVRPMSQQLSVDPEISVFMASEGTRAQSEALEPAIRAVLANPKSRIVFVPREQALGTLKAKSGLSDVLDTLGENPLPDSFILRLDGYNNAADASAVDAIADQLRTLPGVETVQVDSAWVKRLAAALNVLRLVLLFLALTLGMVVVAVWRGSDGFPRTPSSWRSHPGESQDPELRGDRLWLWVLTFVRMTDGLFRGGCDDRR